VKSENWLNWPKFEALKAFTGTLVVRSS
jgi:hypothetical protein